jgi:hypothetical protein
MKSMGDPAHESKEVFLDNKHLQPLEPFDEMVQQSLGPTAQGGALPQMPFNLPPVIPDDETQPTPEKDGEGVTPRANNQLQPSAADQSQLDGPMVDPPKVGREPGSLRAGSNLEAAPSDVIPPPKRQLQSHITFDMFNLVPPGYGLGAANKLFVENEQRDAYLRYQQGFVPRMDNGAPTGLYPAAWQLQDVMPQSLMIEAMMSLRHRLEAIEKTVNEARQTMNVETLPSDVNRQPSSQGLPRRVSPLQPVIDNVQPWTPNKEPAGMYLNPRGFRHLHSSFALPEMRELDARNSGPVLRKRRGLELNLP